MLGNKIKTYRENKKMSQQNLADILKVSVGSISKWENDKTKPTYKCMIRMGEVFEIDVNELMGNLKEEDLTKERVSDWSDEKVIMEFKKYRKKGSDITDKGLRRNYPTLRFQIISRFVSYRRFLSSQGINYDNIKTYNTWTKEKIIDEFNKLQKAEEELHINNLKENHNRLLGAINREYESYENFLKKIGLDYSLIRRYQTWNKQRVIEEFEKYTNNNENLRESVLQNKNSALYKQIRIYFKNYKTFLTKIGYEYNNIRGKIEWTEEKINKEFEKYLNEGKDLKASSMNRENNALYSAIKRKFETYGAYLESMGFHYNEVRGTIEWTNMKVKQDYLQLVKEYNGILCFTGVSLKNNKLYQQIRKRFKSYKNFLKDLGLEEDEIYKILKFEQEIGLAFESLVKEMFERLGLNYEYQYRGIKGIRPDFYNRKNNEIIDVKLSFHTGFKSYTPQSYLKHCKKLTLIYLRGEPFEYDFENLSVVPVDCYYELLKEKGHHDLIIKFEQLKDKLN